MATDDSKALTIPQTDVVPNGGSNKVGINEPLSFDEWKKERLFSKLKGDMILEYHAYVKCFENPLGLREWYNMRNMSRIRQFMAFILLIALGYETYWGMHLCSLTDMKDEQVKFIEFFMGASITQVTAMFFVVVRFLFPAPNAVDAAEKKAP